MRGKIAIVHPQPPSLTIDDVRAKLEEIQKRPSKNRLGDASRAALVHMLENPHAAAVKTCTELAHECGVYPSTLTRLGQKLGFSGFSGLQKVFRNYVENPPLFYSHNAQLLLEAPGKNIPQVVRDLADQEMRNVARIAGQIKTEDLNKAVNQLAKADKIYVAGSRATYSVAFFFASFLRYLRPGGTLLGSPGSLLAEDLAQLTPTDLLVAFSFRPYSLSTINSCRAAISRNIPIVAITDIDSPISYQSALSTVIHTCSHFYLNSAASHFFIAEVLLSALAKNLGTEALLHLDNVEALIEELGLETT